MPTEATDLTIRPGTEADADAVARIHLASRRSAAMPAGVHTDEAVRSWMAGRLPQDEFWIAAVAGAPVGYARCTASWLDDLYVLPSHTGRGIGSALLDVVKARRSDGFCLWVFEMNSSARAFYVRHGLTELERTDGSGNEERSPDIKMAWPGSDPLAFYRGLIDEVDEQLADLLARRVALTRAVQAHKHDAGRDPDREREIANAMAQRAPELGADRLSRIVHAIITESLDAVRA